jgi:hypothetical protein
MNQNTGKPCSKSSVPQVTRIHRQAPRPLPDVDTTTDYTIGKSRHVNVCGAVERFRNARIVEAEAIEEIIAAIIALAGYGEASYKGVTQTNRDAREPQPATEKTNYLSVRQLAARIPYAEKTIRNLMVAGKLVEGRDYFKRCGRVMFSWPAIIDWVENTDASERVGIPLVRGRNHGRES